MIGKAALLYYRFNSNEVELTRLLSAFIREKSKRLHQGKARLHLIYVFPFPSGIHPVGVGADAFLKRKMNITCFTRSVIRRGVFYSTFCCGQFASYCAGPTNHCIAVYPPW